MSAKRPGAMRPRSVSPRRVAGRPGHFVDRLRFGQDAEFADVAAQNAGERSVSSRVNLIRARRFARMRSLRRPNRWKSRRGA